MTDQPRTAIQRNLERLRNQDGMRAADAEAILDVHRHLELVVGSSVSISHHSDVLMRSVKMAREVGGLADALDEREAAEEIVRWINREYDNPETNRGYRKALRAFGRHATDGDLPESIAWVPASYPSTYDPAPDPAEMFAWEAHIKPMIDACENNRDEALIALCWDLGPRTSELHGLRVRSISEGEYGLRVSIENGKNGSRSPTIIKAVPFVRDWLERHPGDGDDYLWSRLSSPKRVSRNMIRKILREAGKRAAVDLPAKPTPTQLRKSSASYLANRNVNQAFLEDHHGWVRGSDKASRYVAVFGDANDRAIAAAHGVDVQADDDEPTMQECVRCEALNEPSRTKCRQCDQALSQEAVEAEAAIDSVKDRIDSLLVTADSVEQRRDLVASKSYLDERAGEMNPDKIHQLLSSVEGEDA